MVTTQYVYQSSIVTEHGVDPDERLRDGVILKHKGDFVTYRGMPEVREGTYGSILRVTHIWEAGEIGELPVDFVLELKPGETYKITNLEGVGNRPRYNIRVQAEGPLYEEGVYKGYGGAEPPPEEDGGMAYGPIMSRLMARPFLQRLMERRSMSLQPRPASRQRGPGPAPPQKQTPSEQRPVQQVPRMFRPRVLVPRQKEEG